MYEFWYNCKKPSKQNHQANAKLCYMYTGSFIIYLETKNALSSPCKGC